MDAKTHKTLTRITRCFLLFLVLRLAEELLIIPRYVNTKGLIACVGGMVILLVYIRLINQPLEKIGVIFSEHKLHKALLLTALFSLVPAVIVYAAEYLRVRAAPGHTVLTVFYESAEHSFSAAGISGLLLWLALGVLITAIHAVFYEIAFRGLLITLGLRSLRFWKINLIQAGLYTFWFLIPIVRLLLYPHTNTSIPVPVLFLVMLAYQMLTSVKLGMMRFSTGAVWVCIFDHIAFGCILDLIHVQQTALDMTVILDEHYYLRILCYQVISTLMVLVYYLKKKEQLREQAKIHYLERAAKKSHSQHIH